MSENISKLSGRKGLKDNLFNRLSDMSKGNQLNAKSDWDQVAADYNLGISTLQGAATFYDFLSPSHLEKKAFVCNGSACLCAGTQNEVRQKLEERFTENHYAEKDIDDNLIGDICCLGRCYEAGAFQIDGCNYSGSAIFDLNDIVTFSKSDKSSGDNYHVGVLASMRILTDDAYQNVEESAASLKRVIDGQQKEVLEEIKLSGLRGRGGAGFPTGIKWESCRDVESDQKYVVCNADEGDPGAYSDRYLLEAQPHRVILGMIVCGYLTGAHEGVIYIRGEYPEAIKSIDNVITIFRENNLLGQSILGSNFEFDLHVIEGAGAYICGEETALIASIEGRRAEVDVRPPFPTEQGLFKKPTVVNNVETFAAIPTLLDIGGQRYQDLGSGKSKGTKLVSLDAGFNKPGIYEVELGTSLDIVIDELGGGYKQPAKALHIGGPLGGIIPIQKTQNLNLDFESFSENGFLLGHASIVCIPESMAMIDYIEHLFQFTAAESCGKCFPCRLGSTRGKEMMSQAKTGHYKIEPQLLADLLDTMERGSLCALGSGLPLPITNALTYFQDELAPYFSSRIPSVNIN